MFKRATCLLGPAKHSLIARTITTSSRILAATEVDHDRVKNGEPQPEHIMSIVHQIAQLKFHEVATLNEILKRELKIPDVQRVAAGPPTAGTESDEAAGETKGGVKSAYTVKLVKFDDKKKVALIKEIKKLVQGINLVEAKRFVEECPKVIGSNLSKDEAEALQKQLETAGGVVKLE